MVEIVLPDGALLAWGTPGAIVRPAGAPVLALIKSTLIEVLGG